MNWESIERESVYAAWHSFTIDNEYMYKIKLLAFYKLTIMYVIILSYETTVDWEIFVVKIFSLLAIVTKI